jgi:tRNA nucleotidyltransferase (CCA-adding enzyme)
MENVYLKIPNDVSKILCILEENNCKAYIVGGCIRDSLVGKEPHDWDICTDAKPEKVKKIFDSLGYETIDTGLKHGTVTLMFGNPTSQYEITTFRIDGDYSDHRRPDNVEFTDDIVEDLSRRDFTINAMACNQKDGIIDPFDGMTSISHKEVKCVGNPYKRFSEDPLRILRALRFGSNGFSNIDINTISAIIRNKDLLNEISKERISSEFTKIITSEHKYDLRIILSLYNKVFEVFIPELIKCYGFEQNNPHHVYDVYEHSVRALCEGYNGKDIITCLAIFFHDIGKPECYSVDSNCIGHFYRHAVVSSNITRGILQRLRYDKDTIEKVCALIKYHESLSIIPCKSSIRRLISVLGTDQFNRLIDVRIADIKAQNPKYTDRLKEIYSVKLLSEEIIKEESCFKIKDLKINGYDLSKIGIEKGPIMGKVLKSLLDDVLSENIDNDKLTLENRALEIVCKYRR